MKLLRCLYAAISMHFTGNLQMQYGASKIRSQVGALQTDKQARAFPSVPSFFLLARPNTFFMDTLARGSLPTDVPFISSLSLQRPRIATSGETKWL